MLQSLQQMTVDSGSCSGLGLSPSGSEHKWREPPPHIKRSLRFLGEMVLLESARLRAGTPQNCPSPFWTKGPWRLIPQSPPVFREKRQKGTCLVLGHPNGTRNGGPASAVAQHERHGLAIVLVKAY